MPEGADQHNEFIFSGELGEHWFGCKATGDGAEDIFSGAVVYLSGTAMSEITVGIKASGSTAEQLKVLGYNTEAIAGTATGFVSFGGYIASLPVYGGVSQDDWLKMSDSGGLGGYAETYTTIGEGRIFAIAKEDQTGSGHGTVEAFVFPWRI